MHVPSIQLHEAETLSEAAALAERFAGSVQILAGGTDILVDLKSGRNRVDHLIAIDALDELRGITESASGLRIGALTTIGELDRNPIVAKRYQAIRDATGEMASPQVRNVATVGGNIAGAVPCADLPPVLMVLGASLVLWSPSGEREVSMDGFFTGPRETILKTNELLIAVLVPQPQDRFGAAYARFALRAGNGIAVAAVAASLWIEADDRFYGVNVALGAVAPTPRPVTPIGGLLEGRRLDQVFLDDAATTAMEAADPISDVRGSADYRRELVGVLTRRALIKAADRAREASR